VSAQVSQADVDSSPAECWVSAKLLAAVAKFAARNEVRYYLEFVRVEPHPKVGVLLIASDGHRMAVVYDQTGRAAEPVAIRPVTFPRTRDDETLVHYSEGRAAIAPQRFVSAECYRDGAPIVGRYPLWRNVLGGRALKQGEVGSFNPKYLADCEAICRAFNRAHPMISVFSDGHKGALIKFDSGVQAIALIMPMRANTPPTPDLPEWVGSLSPVSSVTTLDPKRTKPSRRGPAAVKP
jgi:hypothetical protein